MSLRGSFCVLFLALIALFLTIFTTPARSELKYYFLPTVHQSQWFNVTVRGVEAFLRGHELLPGEEIVFEDVVFYHDNVEIRPDVKHSITCIKHAVEDNYKEDTHVNLVTYVEGEEQHAVVKCGVEGGTENTKLKSLDMTFAFIIDDIDVGNGGFQLEFVYKGFKYTEIWTKYQNAAANEIADFIDLTLIKTKYGKQNIMQFSIDVTRLSTTPNTWYALSLNNTAAAQETFFNFKSPIKRTTTCRMEYKSFEERKFDIVNAIFKYGSLLFGFSEDVSPFPDSAFTLTCPDIGLNLLDPKMRPYRTYWTFGPLLYPWNPSTADNPPYPFELAGFTIAPIDSYTQLEYQYIPTVDQSQWFNVTVTGVEGLIWDRWPQKDEPIFFENVSFSHNGGLIIRPDTIHSITCIRYGLDVYQYINPIYYHEGKVQSGAVYCGENDGHLDSISFLVAMVIDKIELNKCWYQIGGNYKGKLVEDMWQNTHTSRGKDLAKKVQITFHKSQTLAKEVLQFKLSVDEIDTVPIRRYILSVNNTASAQPVFYNAEFPGSILTFCYLTYVDNKYPIQDLRGLFLQGSIVFDFNKATPIVPKSSFSITCPGVGVSLLEPKIAMYETRWTFGPNFYDSNYLHPWYPFQNAGFTVPKF
jgi:hypothetical protein